jgi:hypothetical protein
MASSSTLGLATSAGEASTAMARAAGDSHSASPRQIAARKGMTVRITVLLRKTELDTGNRPFSYLRMTPRAWDYKT